MSRKRGSQQQTKGRKKAKAKAKAKKKAIDPVAFWGDHAVSYTHLTLPTTPYV